MAELTIQLEYDAQKFIEREISLDLNRLTIQNNRASTDLTPDIQYFIHSFFRVNTANSSLTLRLIPEEGFRVRFTDRPDDFSSLINWKTSRVNQRISRERLVYLEAVDGPQEEER